MSWVGPRSRPVRRRLVSLSANRQIAMLPLRTRLGDGGELQIPALSESERAVRIVQAYRHLGTLAQAEAGMGREIASRANAGQAATPGLSRRLLGSEGAFQNTCVFKWPRPVWPVGVRTKRARGMLLRVLSCSDRAVLPGRTGSRPQVRDGSPTMRRRRSCR